MNQASSDILLQGVTLQSSHEELDAAMRKRRYFTWSHEYLKDIHFVRHILPIGIHSMDDVQAFLAKLDADNLAVLNPTGCAKAHSARGFLAHEHGLGDDALSWALVSLAHARRTCCSCHELGSFRVTEPMFTNLHRL